MTLYRIYVPLILLSNSLLFAGCGGASQGPPMGGLPASQPLQVPDDHGRNQDCRNDGGINLRPCHITFDAQNPGPTDVRVTHGGDNDQHKIRERDNCAARDIAMLVRDSNARYTVMPGSMTGSCSAVFDDNGRHDGRHHDDGGRGPNGGSLLRIVNKL